MYKMRSTEEGSSVYLQRLCMMGESQRLGPGVGAECGDYMTRVLPDQREAMVGVNQLCPPDLVFNQVLTSRVIYMYTKSNH